MPESKAIRKQREPTCTIPLSNSRIETVKRFTQYGIVLRLEAFMRAAIPPRPLITIPLLILLGSTFALTTDQQCDINQQIYQNHSSSTMVVTGEFTDRCKDADSYVDVYDKTGQVVGHGTVPDMHTKYLTLDVPPGGTMNFNCRGTGQHNAGHCSST